MRVIITTIFTALFFSLWSQNIDLINGIYGNEWVDHSKSYVKIKVAHDDVYTVTYQDLEAAGAPVNSIDPTTLRLQAWGNDVPYYVQTQNVGRFGPNDYILFYGEKNRTQLDKYFFKEAGTDILNDRYSYISDTAAYFVSWGHTVGQTNLIRKKPINYNAPLPETRTILFTDEHMQTEIPYKPVETVDNVRYSSFRSGEGYGGYFTNNYSETFNVEDRINIGIAPTLTYKFGTNRNSLNVGIFLNDTEVNRVVNSPYISHLVSDTIDLDFSLIASGSLNISARTVAPLAILPCYSILTYTRTIDAAKGIPGVITLPPSTEPQYLRIKNYQGAKVQVINKKTLEIYETDIQNNNLVIYVSASSTNQDLVLVDPPTHAASLSPRIFRDYGKLDHNYIILTSQELNNDVNGINPIEDYASYRKSQAGGGHNVVIVNVEELYDQFAFGIDRHVLGIRGFSNYIANKWTKISYFFIIGKGREYVNQRTALQLNNPIESKMLVPTYGFPGSDNLIVKRPTEATLLFSTGRFAATDKKEVIDYLDKVIEYESNLVNPNTIDDKLWTKEVVHLSGGDRKIQDAIRNQLEEMEEIIETSKMGANVSTYYKFSSTPIEVALSEGLRNDVDKGLALITFFGHSATGNLDFDMGDIRAFSNKGKYPIMIALGCNAGNIHGPDVVGVAERYVKEPQRGMIAFLASSGSAYAYQQYEYGKELYEEIGTANYGGTIGSSINAIIDTFKNVNSLGFETFLEQVTLHGDPALRTQSAPSPDFTPDGKSALTNPSPVNAYEPTFQFCTDIYNLGSEYKDSISVNYTISSNTDVILLDTSIRIFAPLYSQKVCIDLPIDSKSQLGENTIKVWVDNLEEVEELTGPSAEDNNRLAINGEEGFTFLILSTSAQPIYPTEFGITNKVRPTLLASTYNAFDQPYDYIIQFDTSGLFDSPALISRKLEGQRALIEWPVPYDLVHERVYYWRVSPDTTGTNKAYVWNSSSFMYHKDIEGGWNQSHYYQFLRDDFENIKLNPSTKTLEFARNFNEIRIVNREFTNSVDRPHFYVRGNSFNEAMEAGVGKSIAVTVIDSTGEFVRNPMPPLYQTINLRNRPITTFFFQTDTKEKRGEFIRFMREFPRNGNYVIFHTLNVPGLGDFKLDEWEADRVDFGDNIFTILEKEGAELIDNFKEKGKVLPYIFTFIKGDQSSVLSESISNEENEECGSTVLVPGFWFEGKVNAKKIGPAISWKSITWDQIKSALPDNDTTSVQIAGISTNGASQILKTIDAVGTTDISDIDARIFPYLELTFYSKDSKNKTSAHLIKWNTLYEATGDLALEFDATSFVRKDTLQEGDNFAFQLPVFNYSDVAYADIKAEIAIKNKANNSQVSQVNVGNLQARGNAPLTFTLNTTGLEGDFQAGIRVNPANTPMEAHQFNNFATYNFHVFKERINPILDVTFDGIHILDEDIVSAAPLIHISTKDENPFLLLNDTSQYYIELTYPDGTTEDLSMGDPRVRFNPATDGLRNQSSIEVTPTFVNDGLYKLKVKSTDRTGNNSGTQAYEVSFKVIVKEQISDVYNYPNPFSTATEFVFMLTGSELPTEMKIQIMTISGKVVRIIEKEELGPLKMGINRTSYKWDGRDEYGDLLGNGVYLYKVFTNTAAGQRFEAMEDVGNSDFFKKGWGKMVIMR